MLRKIHQCLKIPYIGRLATHPSHHLVPKSGLMCSNMSNKVELDVRDKKEQLQSATPHPPVNIIKEGKAEVLFPESVFYNPVQEFNRDLTVAVISEYAKEHFKKSQKGASSGSCTVDDDSELKAGVYYKDGLRILEGLAASGLRSVRFALEIPGIKEIIVNDYDKNAVSFINKNIAKNQVGHLARESYADASMLMYKSRAYEDNFDVIDLDPYGSPCKFLDGAIQAIKDGGLLCITCTDMAVMSGNNGEAAYLKYGSYGIRSSCCHELGLRSILHSLDSLAGRYSRYIVPILSVSVDFYIRVFVKVFTGAAVAKRSASKQALLYKCSGCEAHSLQHLGEVEIRQNKDCKFTPAVGPPVGMSCEHCGHRHKVGGPYWADRLHDAEFVGSLIQSIQAKKERFKTSERMTGILSMIHEELPEVPLYYVLDNLCHTIHCTMPTIVQFRSAIMNLGYEVSFSHAAKNSIKTTAPVGVLWDILRAWVKNNPVSKKRFQPGSVTKAILDQEPSVEVCFELRKDANPVSRKSGLLRWQENPERDWGPKPRAKRAFDKKDNENEGMTEKRQRLQGKRNRAAEEKMEVVDKESVEE